MKVYLCRWPNNECSIVCAANKGEAIDELDEWDSATPEMLTEITRPFALDFSPVKQPVDPHNQFSKEYDWEFNQATEPFFDEILPKAGPLKSPRLEALARRTSKRASD